MSNTKLTTAFTVYLLFKGAHICYATYRNFKRPYISVHLDLKNYGRITEKQFEEINNEDMIKFLNDRKDKYGNIYNYYVVDENYVNELRKLYRKKKI